MAARPEGIPAGRLALWGALFLLGHGALLWLSPRFAYDVPWAERPTFTAVRLLVLLSLLLFLLPLKEGLQAAGGQRKIDPVLVAMLVLGALARLMMLGSTPIFEDDFYRYLWDGALLAHGFDPFAAAPLAFRTEVAALDRPVPPSLVQEGLPILERIAYPQLRTIYPPLAQVFFALAAGLEPFSLLAWRVVLLGAEIAGLWFLARLLDRAGRPRLWLALYWLNPLVIKEVANAAHMDALLMPFLAGALLARGTGRAVLAGLLLVLAGGIKVWPLLLLPLALAPLLRQPARLAAAATLCAVLALALALPVLRTGLDEQSGFVAYADHWLRNSLLFPLLLGAAEAGGAALGLTALMSGRLLKGVLAFGLGALALGLAWRTQESRDIRTLAPAFLAIALALFFVSPAQYPWYALWALPFAVVAGYRPILWLTAGLTLYPLSFPLLLGDAPPLPVTPLALAALQFAPFALAALWHERRRRLGPAAP